jgi:hypothetical protein
VRELLSTRRLTLVRTTTRPARCSPTISLLMSSPRARSSQRQSARTRLCKYIHNDQCDSYLLNPPLAALLAAAGYDHEMPRAACAAHLSIPVTEELVSALLPELIKAQALVETEFADVSTGSEAKAKRLFCARGCGHALRLIVDTFIACSAARARNEDGHIVADSEPIYKRFFAKNLLFQLPFFSCRLFLGFAGKVAAAEERELAGEADSAEAAGGIALSPGKRAIDELFVRRLEPLRATMSLLVGANSQAAPATAAAAVGAAAAESAVGPAAAASAVGPATAASAVGAAAAPTAVGAAAAASDVQAAPGSNQKKRKSLTATAAATVAKRGPGGVVVYVLAGGKTTVEELWNEYTTGLSNGPAVRDLVRDHGTKWRAPGGASRTAWWKHSYVYEEIERRVAAGASEANAVAGVQVRLDALAKPPRAGGRGRGRAKVNWSALYAELQRVNPRKSAAAAEIDISEHI